jgi:hypothetical protein
MMKSRKVIWAGNAARIERRRIYMGHWGENQKVSDH